MSRGPSEHGPSFAPAWHTAALVGLIVAVAVAGSVMTRGGASPVGAAPTGIARFAPIVLVQAALALYVTRVGRSRSALAELVGARWTSLRRALTDVALGAAGWGLIEAAEFAWATLAGGSGAAAGPGILPHTLPDRLAWTLTAIVVGVVEELVYRGYLQAQLAAFTRRASLATVLQAALFGVAHLDQGVSAAARMALYGLGLGLLARCRGSLLPGMVCHAWTDAASGWLAR